MKEKYRQGFRYFRMIAKSIGMLFALVGILLFLLQYFPTYKGVGFYVFVAGGLVWALDTLWTTFDDWKELGKEIKEHRLG